MMQDFIKHSGDNVPVEENTLVGVILRDGIVQTGKAKDFITAPKYNTSRNTWEDGNQWLDDGSDSDILHYKILTED
jgi:hypothetical protein